MRRLAAAGTDASGPSHAVHAGEGRTPAGGDR